mgnify:CR=1 FL=1
MSAPQPQLDRPIHLLAITRKPNSASFEHRIVRYTEGLADRDIKLTIRVLPSSVRGQWRLLAESRRFDGVWWQRHLVTPWIAMRMHRDRPPIVFDFDDPLVYSARDGRRRWTRQSRFSRTLRRCTAALAASETLAALARPYCSWVIELPMAIDVPIQPPPRNQMNDQCLQLLWLGSATTQPYLNLIREPLIALGHRRHDVKLRLVTHQPMTFGQLEVDFRPWSPSEQAMALQECDVGLCPMPDTVWTQGKCPYKVLQYMAHAIPWVGSAVGENRVMAGSGEQEPRGLCASTNEEWLQMLLRLIEDVRLRAAIGHRAHQYVARHHRREVLVNRLSQFWRKLIVGRSNA